MAELMMINPAKKRKRKRPVRARSRRGSRRRVSALRRNPIRKMSVKGIVNDAVMPAATAAAGAIGLDVMMGYLPIPDNLKTGPARYLVKGVGAIGLGMIAQAVGLKASTARAMTTGALTVALYEAGKGAIVTAAPDFAARAGLDGLGIYDTNVRPGSMRLGYANSGYPAGQNLGMYYTQQPQYR